MPRITEIYAFITTDTGPDDEGIIASLVGNTWIPLVGADSARLDSLRLLATHVARELGKSVKLVRFTNREELEDIGAPV